MSDLSPTMLTNGQTQPTDCHTQSTGQAPVAAAAALAEEVAAAAVVMAEDTVVVVVVGAGTVVASAAAATEVPVEAGAVEATRGPTRGKKMILSRIFSSWRSAARRYSVSFLLFY